MGNGIGDGVGAHRESSDMSRIETALSYQVESHVTHEHLAFCAHGRGAGIDVVVRTCPAGEGKIAETYGPHNQEAFQLIAMTHRRHSVRASPRMQGSPKRRPRSWVGATCLLVVLLAMAGCTDNGGIGPGTLRFGQLGEITVDLFTPLRLGLGELRQTLIWESSGAWSVRERISYKTVVGDETLVRSAGDPAAFASEYASLIVRVNEVAGLELFIDGFPPGITAPCGPTRTRIVFSIYDSPRDSTATWSQCADGSLSGITPVGAGPEPPAARLVVATQQARDATVGEGFLSAYHGSVPFGTLARGEDTEAEPAAAFVVTDQVEWGKFWLEHSGTSEAPAVDFEMEMVIVGAVGERSEAGDSVEVRRILEVGDGTNAHLFERRPGDFCSPAAVKHYPFHVVVSPLTPAPIRFAQVETELVSCGG